MPFQLLLSETSVNVSAFQFIHVYSLKDVQFYKFLSKKSESVHASSKPYKTVLFVPLWLGRDYFGVWYRLESDKGLPL